MPAETGSVRFVAVRAVGLETLGVKIERVVLDLEPPLFRDSYLTLLDLGVEEFLYVPAAETHEVVVVPTLVELEYCLASLEIVPLEQPGLFELGEHPINGGQADIHAFGHQRPINIFSGQMALFGVLEKIENLQAGVSRLQADVLQIFGIVGHGKALWWQHWRCVVRHVGAHCL